MLLSELSIMKTLLRDAFTGQYFQALGKWTGDREDAYDFGLVARALRFARKARLPGLELILAFESPESIPPISFGELCHSGAQVR